MACARQGIAQLNSKSASQRVLREADTAPIQAAKACLPLRIICIMKLLAINRDLGEFRKRFIGHIMFFNALMTCRLDTRYRIISITMAEAHPGDLSLFR